MSPTLQQNRKNQEKLLDGNTVNDISSMLIPMMFAAIKAILCASPSFKSIPEVEAIIALEPLVSPSFTVQRHGFSE